jgi:hypothetical protein
VPPIFYSQITINDYLLAAVAQEFHPMKKPPNLTVICYPEDSIKDKYD